MKKILKNFLVIFLFFILKNSEILAGFNMLENSKNSEIAFNFNNSNINFLAVEIGDLDLGENGEKLPLKNITYKLKGKIINDYNVSLKWKNIEKKIKANITNLERQKKILNILKEAYGYLGVKYTWGGNTKKNGVDCSGLVKNAFEKEKVFLPRVSRLQSEESKRISKKEATIGDLIFFKTTDEDVVSHIGIYLGDNLFIHASSGYRQVVITELKGFYSTTFSHFGRIDV